MKLREDVKVHEKTPKIHLVPPLDKEPIEYLKLYDTIYQEICDRLNKGSGIGGCIRSVEGIYLLNGEIVDDNNKSIDGEVRNGKIYRGHMFQMAVVYDGRVSFGSHGYKENSILREGRTERPQEEPIEDLDEQSLSILEQIANKYNFRVVSEFIEPFFQEKYLPDMLKKARQNPKNNSQSGEKREAGKSGSKRDGRQQTSGTPSGTPSYENGYRREATQVYKR